MKTLISHLLSWTLIISSVAAFPQQSPRELAKYETTYDNAKQETTVRLLPVKLSGEKGKYHSLHMSPSFKFPGEVPAQPSIIDFELQIVVKGRLRTDLYVVFVVDGEKIFLSSSRWAVMRPVPGRVWMGERLVFRMPYETLMKLAAAKSLQIKLDAVVFDIGEEQRRLIRDLASKIDAIPVLPVQNRAR